MNTVEAYSGILGDGALTEGDTALTLTRELCDYLAGLTFNDMPAAVVHEARRGVLDWIGCALAGSGHRTIDILLNGLAALGSSPVATIFGRNRKLGMLEAAIANGQMGHVLDYDDTHLSGTTVIHTSSPVLAALFALSERQCISGQSFLLAYATAFEAGVRVGHTAPRHLERGWHLTGTLGTIAAAVAAGKMLKLDGRPLAHAMAIGATQAAGMQQNRGTMCKSFHSGKAASNGILAALLAKEGFDSSLEIIEGPLGFCRVYSDVSEPQMLTERLGERWELLRNGHKPYACGVVLHPVIDATLGIRSRIRPALDSIERIDVRAHRHVTTVTGTRFPQTGLAAKFSVFHSVAVALCDGAAGASQYTDARLADPALGSLYARINVTIDDSLRKDQAHVSMLIDGQRHEAIVEHASGTTRNPMTDAALEEKFHANADPVIGAERARSVAERIWRLDRLDDVGMIPAACG
jgi:2-methylcitrate dehydratase PrpD